MELEPGSHTCDEPASAVVTTQADTNTVTTSHTSLPQVHCTLTIPTLIAGEYGDKLIILSR